MGSRHKHALFAFAFAALITSPVVRADDAKSDEAEPRPAYTLVVDSDDPAAISYDAIATRVGSDLGAPVARVGEARRVAIHVRYRSVERMLSVRAVHDGGRVLERSVAAEGDASELQREAVLLCGNLARDEARELLDELSTRAPKPVESDTTTTKEEADTLPITVGFIYPIATNKGQPEVATKVDLSFGYGRVGRVDAMQLGLGGVQASRELHGFQGAVGATISNRITRGAQAAVGTTLAFGDLHGFQGAAGLAFVNGDVEGAQVTAGMSIALGNVHGYQGSALFNTGRDLRGVQATAGANVARDVSGAQLGIVNVGRKVSGLQLGFVNVAEEADAAVGIVSITRDGIHPIVWTSNLDYMNIGFKFQSKYIYSLAAFSLGTLETDLDGLGGTLALGTQIPIVASLDLGIECAGSYIVKSPREQNAAAHPRLLAGYSFSPRFRLFAGGGIRIPTSWDTGSPVVRPEAVAGVQL